MNPLNGIRAFVEADGASIGFGASALAMAVTGVLRMLKDTHADEPGKEIIK